MGWVLRVFVFHAGITPLRNVPEWFNTVISGNVPKWGQYPAGVFPETLRGVLM